LRGGSRDSGVVSDIFEYDCCYLLFAVLIDIDVTLHQIIVIAILHDDVTKQQLV